MTMTITTNTTLQQTTTPPVGGTTQGGPVTGTGTGAGVGGMSGNSPPVDNGTQGSGGQVQTTGLRSNDSFGSIARLEETEQTLATALQALNDLIQGLRDPDQLAALLVEMNALQRQNALDQRLASRDTAKAQLEGQAAEMVQAAMKEIASAAVAVAMAVVSFAVSFVGAIKTGEGAKDGANAGKLAAASSKEAAGLKEASKLGKTIEGIEDLGQMARAMKENAKLKGIESQSAFASVDRISMLTQAITSLVKGLSEGIEGSLRATGKMDEAQGQILAANAEDNKGDADALKSFMDSIDELVRTALEFMKKLNDTEVELMASASRL